MEWKKIADLYWTDESGSFLPLSAGSGLVRSGDSLWVAADDLHHLVRVPLDGSQSGSGHRILPGDVPADKVLLKEMKPDTEALIDISWDGKRRLVAFPSGSKPNRTRGAAVTVDDANKVLSTQVVDFSPVIHLLNQRLPDLNIEGGAVWNDKVVLMQRGNGKAGVNAVVELDRLAFIEGINGAWDSQRVFHAIHEVRLPEINGVPLTFTDAEVVNGALFFSAAAEAGEDTYLDGEVMGSAIGSLDHKYLPTIHGTISRVKAEGLAFFRATGDQLEFFLVTDADDPSVPSELMKASISI